MLNERPVELLLVENSPADVRLVVEAQRHSATPTHLSVARDGYAALAFMRREGVHAAAIALMLASGEALDGRWTSNARPSTSAV